MNDFKLVGYIPKPAFSSLLVLGFIDMTWTWFVRSYFKTKNKTEWLVTPLIMILAFAVGVLQSVFFGLAMSTFLFVAALFRTGVVKYVANGITIRSTVERVAKDANWLDHNGDLIQILVLQNYLFFGNASSIFGYITSIFEVQSPGIDPHFVSPKAQYLILDFTLVTGMDTSAVDVFADVLSLCNNHKCKLFLSGVSRNLREVMTAGGLRGDPMLSSDRKLRFLSTLDGAVGKAEDLLLEHERAENSVDDSAKFNGNGFAKALQRIDEQVS
jgi:SulP family sulfate permease